MKALAFSDVHLGAHGRTDDQEAVLARIADLAVTEAVDAVLFAGDMFEGPGVPSSHYMRVRRAFIAPLAAAGIRTVAISGNQTHDSAGNQGEDNAMAVLHQPGVFDVYTRPGLHPIYDKEERDAESGEGSERLLSRYDVHPDDQPAALEAHGSERGRTDRVGGEPDRDAGAQLLRADGRAGGSAAVPGLVVACVPWASVNRLRAHLNGTDDADALAAQLVIRIMEQLRAEASRDYPGVPCCLVSHFATTGWRTPTGLPTDEIRDVVLPLDEIERLGFDVALFGHIHAPGVISENGGRPIISLGSPGCLNHGEGSVPHGVWILGGEVPEFRPIDGRRFVTHAWNQETDPEVYDEILLGDFMGMEDVPGAIVRLRYKATADQDRRIDRAALKAALLAAGAHEVTVEATVERETRARVAEMSAHLSPLDALDLYLAAQGVNGRVGAGVRAWTATAMEATG